MEMNEIITIAPKFSLLFSVSLWFKFTILSVHLGGFYEDD
jgi:hypothetical protein